MRNRKTTVTIGASLAVLLALLAGCVHTELIWRDFDGERLFVDVRVDPDARIDASYYLKVDPDDPVGTVVSVGSSIAKAAEVQDAQVRMGRAMANLDLERLIYDELADRFQDVERMHVVDRRGEADYVLEVEIWRYGIRANDELGGTFYEMHARSRLRDETTATLVWEDFSMVERRIGPDVFGIPSVDNVLSAVMLAGLSEDAMGAGISRVSREAAWEIGEQFGRDLRRAQRRR